jgi:hypothetical protein
MIVYVSLLNEGTDVWRPVEAESLGENRFRLLESEPHDENWEFPSNSIVRCDLKTLSGERVLVAVRLV